MPIPVLLGIDRLHGLNDQEAEQGFVRSKGFKGESMRELATEVRLSSTYQDAIADGSSVTFSRRAQNHTGTLLVGRPRGRSLWRWLPKKS